MSDSNDSDDQDLPSAKECEERCQQFAAITGTDSALAMFYLQDRDWILDRALNAFFEEKGGSPPPTAGSTPASVPVSTAQAAPMVTATSQESSDKKSMKGATACTDKEPHRIRLLSWNIDGLDSANLKSRIKAVCAIVNKDKPHVVFLQEVIGQTLALLEKYCPLYQVIPGGQGDFDYFTAIMLNVEAVDYEESTITPYFSSRMGRNLLTAKCRVKGISCQVMTAHLESTKDHATERKKQLSTALEQVLKADPGRTVVFGGDLNLRDKELDEIGGLPNSIVDIWETTGMRPEAKFTWDLTKNDNLNWNAKFRPRCRFDRLYIRHPQPKAVIQPVYFELVGIERLASCQRFPSDHWGLLTHYNILSRIPPGVK